MDRVGLPMGHPWSDFLDLLDGFKSEFAPHVKVSRAEIRYFVNKLHQQHLQKTSNDSNSYS